jgi:hypothetical protein
MAIAVFSTLWLYRTWDRNEQRYARESLASRLRKQLIKLQLDVSRFLEGRQVEDLSADEVYVLAKVVPDFTKEKRLQAYREILRDALQQNYFTAANSVEKLQYMRQELDISDDEHNSCLEKLGQEDPELLNPSPARNLENWLRLTSYRESLQGMLDSWFQRRPETGLAADLFEVIEGKRSIKSIPELAPDFIHENSKALRANRREYGITFEEEQQILKDLERISKP